MIMKIHCLNQRLCIFYFIVMVFLIISLEEEILNLFLFNTILNIHGKLLMIMKIHCLNQQENGKKFDKKNAKNWKRINLIDHFISKKLRNEQNGINIEKVADRNLIEIKYISYYIIIST